MAVVWWGSGVGEGDWMMEESGGGIVVVTVGGWL